MLYVFYVCLTVFLLVKVFMGQVVEIKPMWFDLLFDVLLCMVTCCHKGCRDKRQHILLMNERRSRWKHLQRILLPYPPQSLPGCLCCRWAGIHRWATAETRTGWRARAGCTHRGSGETCRLMSAAAGASGDRVLASTHKTRSLYGVQNHRSTQWIVNGMSMPC